MRTKFVSQNFEKLVIQTIFGFFNADERRWCRILDQKKIGEDFERTIRHLLSIEWVLKAFVIEPQKQPFVRAYFGINTLDTRDFSGNAIQNMFETFGVFTFHKLNNITQVISMVIQMSLRTGQRQTARGIRGKVTQVPSFDKLSES